MSNDYDPDAIADALANPLFKLDDHDANPLFKLDDQPSPMLRWEDSNDQLIFGPLDFDNMSYSPFFTSPATSPNFSNTGSPGALDLASHDPNFVYPPYPDQDFDEGNFYLSHWTQDSDSPAFHPASAPLPIPSPLDLPSHPHPSSGPSFVPFVDHHSFPQDHSYNSPQHYALPPSPQQGGALLLAPQPQSFDPHHEATVYPTWASHLWDTPRSQPQPQPQPHPILFHSSSSASVSSSSYRDNTIRATAGLPASAPSAGMGPGPIRARRYSHRAGSDVPDDDALSTVRRKKRPADDTLSPSRDTEPSESSPPQKSTLRPPKLAPSTWQLYFTDWIQKHQMSNDKKLNVAQAAKEAGIEYASLTPEEKEPFKRRSQAAKEARERELAAWSRTLTPSDIKRENAFRTAQRKAGKSRRGNIKDPNAPKKPLSAYFMFLQRIRSDPELVSDVFGDEVETTKQSVLAAGKWRAMTDEERKPFLAQAEQEKLDYEAKRRVYEDGGAGATGGLAGSAGTNISFSILPRSPAALLKGRPFKLDRALSSESESGDDHEHDGLPSTFVDESLRPGERS